MPIEHCVPGAGAVPILDYKIQEAWDMNREDYIQYLRDLADQVRDLGDALPFAAGPGIRDPDSLNLGKLQVYRMIERVLRDTLYNTVDYWA